VRVDRVAALGWIGVREPELRAGDGRHFAREPDHRQGVSPVGFDIDVEHGVAVDIDQRSAERRIVRKDQDAIGIRGQAELFPRAQHAVARHAHLLGALDLTTARQDRSGQGDGDALTGFDVRRPTHDLERCARSDRDGRERQPVGAGMAFDREQLADDHVLPVGAPALDGLDFHPKQSQSLGQELGGQLDIDVVA
jgi:hypothetical protein